MTSSILNSKRVSKTTVRSIFWNWLILSFFERVISLTWTKANKRMDPDFSKNQRKVRKLSIWLNRGPINFSEFSREIFSFFSLRVLLIELQISYCLSFFVFESHDMVIESGKNLPIDSEIMILNFQYLYDLLYIIWKRAICRFQKYPLPQNLMIVVEITVIFRSRWSKWLFSTKSTENAHVMHG